MRRTRIKLVQICAGHLSTFGGINLEDIKAPECFEVETKLKNLLDIPVFHDDQHGTAIISGAGLLNALEITGKKIDEIKLVVCGAGAAAISCSRLYISLGVKKENIVMVDSKGVVNRKRTDLNKYKMEFITDRDISTLAEAVKGADLFLGFPKPIHLQRKCLVQWLTSPLFSLWPIRIRRSHMKTQCQQGRDLIFATGRSDYPNQINNVLGFRSFSGGLLMSGLQQ